jgi:hypothetical protein
LIISNAINPTDPLIYSGTFGPDPFAAVFDVQSRSGVLYSVVSSAGEVIVVPVSLQVDGTFTGAIPAATTQRSGPAALNTRTPLVAASAEKRTVRGRVVNGALSGMVEELGLSFAATVQPATGPTAALAGVYTGGTILSASGTTHLVVNAQGQVSVFSTNSTMVTSGTGPISATGAFTIQTPQSVTIEGSVSGATRLLKGTVKLPGQPAADLLGIGANSARTDRLVNLSSRVRVGESGGGRALISGFVVGGTDSKRMLLRAIGPGLGNFGVQGALGNPRLQLFDSAGRMVAQNDDWGSEADITAVGDSFGAFKLILGSRDSALMASLDPGVYTVQVVSGGGDGVALVEIYDTSEALQAASLVNLSTRGYIEADEGAIISGFVVSGNVPKRLLVRGIGPALQAFGLAGVVADPVLQIHRNSVLIAQNDNWETPQPVEAAQSAALAADLAAAAGRVGAFPIPAGSRDAAIMILLPPGSYTARLSGKNDTTGSGLLEIYQISND